jgi:soluble P-type ATPase
MFGSPIFRLLRDITNPLQHIILFLDWADQIKLAEKLKLPADRIVAVGQGLNNVRFNHVVQSQPIHIVCTPEFDLL